MRSLSVAVESVPGKLSWARVLKGARMLLIAVFENLETRANVVEPAEVRKERRCEADMLSLVSASNLPTPIFLGYCAKEIWVPTEEWCRAWGAHIGEIASVSDCLSYRAPNWVDRWDFNRSTFWNDESLAQAAVPAGRLPHFRLVCYRLLPILFGASGEPKSVSIEDLFTDGLPGLPDEPDFSKYRTLGYDIVEATNDTLGFGLRLLAPVL